MYHEVKPDPTEDKGWLIFGGLFLCLLVGPPIVVSIVAGLSWLCGRAC